MNIAYCGDFQFPIGGAYTARAINLGKLLHEAGHTVTFHATANSQDQREGTVPFPYRNLVRQGVKANYSFSSIVSFLGAGKSALKVMMEKNEIPDAVILAGGYTRYFVPFRKACRQMGIPLYMEICEWLNYRALPLGCMGPMTWDVAFAMNFLHSRADGLIVISRYLENYYREHGVKNIYRLPGLVDLQEPMWKEDSPAESFDPNCLNLVYAGWPGRKDCIGNVILAVRDLHREKFPVKLHLLGPSNDMVALLGKENADIPGILGKALFLYGKIPHEKIPSYLRRADFSVLLRENTRNANAGFPTKMGESFAAGVPMIANATGDIGCYLQDGKNGLLVDDWSVEAIKQTLKRARSLSPEQRGEMRIQAKKTAGRLDFRNFVNDMDAFFHGITR